MADSSAGESAMDELVSVSGWCYGLFPDGRGSLLPPPVTEELVERPVIQGDLAEIANLHSGYKLDRKSTRLNSSHRP